MKPIRKTETDILCNLEPGDILLYNSSTVIGKMIKLISQSTYSHAGLYVGKGQVIEVLSEGIKRRTLDNSLKDVNYVSIYRHKDIKDHQEEIINEAEKKFQEFQEYSCSQIVGIALICITRNCSALNQLARGFVYMVINTARYLAQQNPRVLKEAMICSEFVYRVYEGVCRIELVKCCEAIGDMEQNYSLKIPPIDRNCILTDEELISMFRKIDETENHDQVCAAIPGVNEDDKHRKVIEQLTALREIFTETLFDVLGGSETVHADLVTPRDLSNARNLIYIGDHNCSIKSPVKKRFW